MKLPLLSGQQVLGALERLGFVESHRTGSHVKLIHPDGRRIIVPYHDPVNRYTLRGALRGAGVDIDDFLDKVKLQPFPSPGVKPGIIHQSSARRSRASGQHP